MTPEQIKKLDAELFFLRERIINDVHWYNKQFKELEKVRPSQFARRSPSKFDSGCEGVMGLILKEKLLDDIMLNS